MSFGCVFDLRCFSDWIATSQPALPVRQKPFKVSGNNPHQFSKSSLTKLTPLVLGDTFITAGERGLIGERSWSRLFRRQWLPSYVRSWLNAALLKRKLSSLNTCFKTIVRLLFSQNITSTLSSISARSPIIVRRLLTQAELKYCKLRPTNQIFRNVLEGGGRDFKPRNIFLDLVIKLKNIIFRSSLQYILGPHIAYCMFGRSTYMVRIIQFWAKSLEVDLYAAIYGKEISVCPSDTNIKCSLITFHKLK